MNKDIDTIIESEEKGFWKITMKNGLVYAWVFENGKNFEYNEELIDSIKIVHNFQKKAMIDIKTIYGVNYRQEINQWNERNSKGWIVDNYVLI